MATKKSYGRKIHLFSKAGNTRLIVSAHGCAPGDLSSKFTCPGDGWEAVVWRTSIHGLCTTSQVRDIVNYRNHSGSHGGEGNVWQQSFTPMKQTNWELSKYVASKGKGPDTYHDYLDIAENEGFDIASPRDWWRSRETNIETLLSLIPNKALYKEIWFSFCLEK